MDGICGRICLIGGFHFGSLQGLKWYNDYNEDMNTGEHIDSLLNHIGKWVLLLFGQQHD